jgi:hypothetical protein
MSTSHDLLVRHIIRARVKNSIRLLLCMEAPFRRRTRIICASTAHERSKHLEDAVQLFEIEFPAPPECGGSTLII